MTNQTKPQRPAATLNEKDLLAQRELSVRIANASAPTYFVDEAAAYSRAEVICITLVTVKATVFPSGPGTDSVPVAHLRMTAQGAQKLLSSLNALLTAKAVASVPKQGEILPH
jgi:hypothetical protein